MPTLHEIVAALSARPDLAGATHAEALAAITAPTPRAFNVAELRARSLLADPSLTDRLRNVVASETATDAQKRAASRGLDLFASGITELAAQSPHWYRFADDLDTLEGVTPAPFEPAEVAMLQDMMLTPSPVTGATVEHVATAREYLARLAWVNDWREQSRVTLGEDLTDGIVTGKADLKNALIV